MELEKWGSWMTVDYNTSFTLPSESSFTKEGGYTQTGWTINNVFYDFGSSCSVLSDTTVKAFWTLPVIQVETTIEYDLNGGETSPNDLTYNVISGNSYTLLTKGFSKAVTICLREYLCQRFGNIIRSRKDHNDASQRSDVVRTVDCTSKHER